MKLVVIESPLSAPTREGIEENKKYAKACMLNSLRRGEAPYASHLLFDQPGLLDDLSPSERTLGMQAGFAWGDRADLVTVYVDRGVSHGMVLGCIRARECKQTIEYRSLMPGTSIHVVEDEIVVEFPIKDIAVPFSFKYRVGK